MNLTGDSGVKDALGFLMSREISHQTSFGKALYAIEPNFPPGKRPGVPQFAGLYVNTSKGQDDVRGSWNSDGNFNFVTDGEKFLAMGGGDGIPVIKPSSAEHAARGQRAREPNRFTPARCPTASSARIPGSARWWRSSHAPAGATPG